LRCNISIICGGVFLGAGFIPARIAALAAVWAGIKPAPTLTFFVRWKIEPRDIEKIL
jgi:hypothetical protein